jgi:hypothetical protein
MSRRTTLVLGLALSVWSAGARAEVDSSSAVPTPEQQEQARRDLAAGQRLLKKERFEAALVKLQAAYAVEPTAVTLLGVAIAERATDRIPEAYRSYERLLAGPTVALSTEARDRAQRAVTEMGAVTGAVRLTLSEPDATITIDDRPLDADGLTHPIHLSGGRHVFAAAKSGFEPLSFAVFITVGTVLDTSLTLKPEAGAALPEPPPVVAPALATPPPAAAFPGTAPTPPAPPEPKAPLPPPAPPPPSVTPPATAPEPPPPPIPAAPLWPSASPLPAESQASPPAPGAGPFTDGPHVGFLLGVVTLPRPVAGELMVKLGAAFALGLKGSYLPELSVPGTEAKLELKALEGIVRWFPGGGSFFLGAGFGYQSFRGSLGQTVDGNELTVTADMSGLFVQPQLGAVWILRSGFAISFSIGVQIPIPKDPVMSASYEGQSVPDQATSTIPQDVVDQAESSKKSVQSVARLIVKYPFPTLDLFRIGFFF